MSENTSSSLETSKKPQMVDYETLLAKMKTAVNTAVESKSKYKPLRDVIAMMAGEIDAAIEKGMSRNEVIETLQTLPEVSSMAKSGTLRIYIGEVLRDFRATKNTENLIETIETDAKKKVTKKSNKKKKDENDDNNNKNNSANQDGVKDNKTGNSDNGLNNSQDTSLDDL